MKCVNKKQKGVCYFSPLKFLTFFQKEMGKNRGKNEKQAKNLKYNGAI